MRIAELVSLGKLRPVAGIEHWQTRIARPLRKTVFGGHNIFADDVAKYLLQNYSTIEECESDIPAHLPPFPSMFIECDVSMIRITDHKIREAPTGNPKGISSLGYHFTTNTVDHPEDIIADYGDDLDRVVGDNDIGDLQNVRWIVQADMFIGQGNVGAIGPLLSITYFCDAHGVKIPWAMFVRGVDEESLQAVGLDATAVIAAARALPSDQRAAFYQREADKAHALHRRHETAMMELEGAITCLRLRLVPEFALGLMHCKNVEVVVAGITHQGEVPESIRAAGGARVRYKVLKINPMMRSVVRRDGGVGGWENALHIVRGHFRDYRHGRGLFGKHRGIFWWSPHLRGDEKHGTIVKDYAVGTRGASMEAATNG